MVYACRSNYKTEKEKNKNKSNYEEEINISVFCFPKNPDERERWKKTVPNADFEVGDNTVICELHWLPGCEKISHYGKSRPKTVWEGVPSSQIPTDPPPEKFSMNISK